MKIFIIYAIVIIAVVGLGVVLFNSSETPENQVQIGEVFESQGQDHITEGSTEHPAYNTNPPTSGWHWPAPARCLVYDLPQPDERLIHNLEHGAIWISYKPEVDADTQAKLKDFERRFSNIVVEPRPTNDSNIAVAAWTRLLKLEQYDETKILDFIGAYMDKGPERVACAQ